MDRELIFQTLFDLTAAATWSTHPSGFVTRSRRVKLFSDVPVEQQPALFQAEHADPTSQVTNLPYKNILTANWIIYQCKAKDPAAIPATENNLILDALDIIIAPKVADPGFHFKRNTLGGLVHHCYIDGIQFKDPGDIDGQGMLIVPIKLLVP